MGLGVLKEPFFIIPFKRCERKVHWKMPLSMQRKMEVWRWASKMGLWQKWSRTQRSKKILREMNERRLRRLGK